MKPRELSPEDCANLLSTSKYGRLGMSIDDLPYVIPMSFVYSDGMIFLHSKGRGKKIDLVSRNSNICFQIDRLEKDNWASVIVYGKARLTSELNAKRKMFDIFNQKGLGGHGGKQFQMEELEKMEMTIWEIEVLEMTGREGIW